MNQFPPSPWIQSGPFRILSKIRGDIRSSGCTTGVVDTGGKWKKSSIIKVLIILFGHLWEVELTYRWNIFAFKFTLRSQQPDIVPLLFRISQRIFRQNFEMVLMEYSGAGGKLIHEKNRRKKLVNLSLWEVEDGPAHEKRQLTAKLRTIIIYSKDLI